MLDDKIYYQTVRFFFTRHLSSMNTILYNKRRDWLFVSPIPRVIATSRS